MNAIELVVGSEDLSARLLPSENANQEDEECAWTKSLLEEIRSSPRRRAAARLEYQTTSRTLEKMLGNGGTASDIVDHILSSPNYVDPLVSQWVEADLAGFPWNGALAALRASKRDRRTREQMAGCINLACMGC